MCVLEKPDERLEETLRAVETDDLVVVNDTRRAPVRTTRSARRGCDARAVERRDACRERWRDPGSRRAATDSSRRLGHAAKKSPSSGTNGDVAKGDAFPARDLADSLSAFAAVDFSAEKSMLENAGLTPPTRAVNKAAATPASGRRALGDLAASRDGPFRDDDDRREAETRRERV